MENVIYKVYCETTEKWFSFKDKSKALAYFYKITYYGKTAKIIEKRKVENRNYEQIKFNL